MEEIKVGEYVRTKQGYIAKLININREFGLLEFDKNIYKESYKPSNIINFNKFNKRYLKHSKNIIDLIEVGDYVNGQLIEKIHKKEKDKIYYEFLQNEDGSYEVMEMCELKNIKSIVTKEQFSNIKYRLED